MTYLWRCSIRVTLESSLFFFPPTPLTFFLRRLYEDYLKPSVDHFQDNTLIEKSELGVQSLPTKRRNIVQDRSESCRKNEIDMSDTW